MSTAGTNPSKSESNRPGTVFYILLAAGLFVFIKSFALVSPILLSLMLILLISLAVNPVIARMRAWSGGRKGASGLLALLVVGSIGLTGWAFVVPMKNSVTMLAEQLPEYWERLQKPLIKLEQKAVRSEKKMQAEVSSEIDQENAASTEPIAEPTGSETTVPEPEMGSKTDLGSVRSSMVQMLEGVIGRFSAVAINGAQILIVLVTVFFGVVYTLMNPRPIIGALFSLVPEARHDQALTILRRIGEFVPRWAGATALGMVAIGLMVFLAMWPFFGFMDALVLGLIAGLFEAIPFLGPLLSAVPAVLLGFGDGGATPLWVALAYLGIQALENNIVVPYVMARGMRLHPLAVIFSMLLCVAAFGVLGVLVAAPLVAIVSILHDELYRKRFLPTITDADLDRLSRLALHEKVSAER